MFLLITIITGVAAWALCGLLTYGFVFAYFQRKWPEIAARSYKGDRLLAIFTGITGPIGLLIAFLMGETRHGLKWR